MLLLFRLHQALKKSKSFFEIPIFKQRPEGACCGIQNKLRKRYNRGMLFIERFCPLYIPSSQICGKLKNFPAMLKITIQLDPSLSLLFLNQISHYFSYMWVIRVVRCLIGFIFNISLLFGFQKNKKKFNTWLDYYVDE